MLQTISLVGSVSAGSTKVLASRPLPGNIRIKRITASFALNQARLVQISPFLSFDAEKPSSGFPGGTNLLQFVSSQHYLVGDDDTKVIELDYLVTDTPTWLKVYANNTDGFDHDVDVQIIIAISDSKGG